jgi:hypothetical protein
VRVYAEPPPPVCIPSGLYVPLGIGGVQIRAGPVSPVPWVTGRVVRRVGARPAGVTGATYAHHAAVMVAVEPHQSVPVGVGRAHSDDEGGSSRYAQE